MIEAIVKGLGFGLLLAIAVGPLLFAIIRQSLQYGHKGGIAFIIGISVSDILLVLICNIFTELFNRIKAFSFIMGIAGCILLVGIGVYYLFFKKIKTVTERDSLLVPFRKSDYVKMFFSGFFINGLNPGIFIFWMTTSTAAMVHTVNDRIIIFVTCLLFVLATDLLKVFLAGKIRNRLTPHNIHLVNRVNGVILIGFGLSLLGILLYKYYHYL